jgi:hypothetical protein
MKVAKGTFAANTGTGSQSVTGLSFQPKAVIFFATALTAEGYGAHAQMSVGFATSSTEEYAVHVGFEDNQTSTDTGRNAFSDRCISIPNASAAETSQDGAADFTSFNSDGFTINWSDAPSSAWLIHYLALGGDGLTNAKAGNFTIATSGSPQAFTPLSFQPDLVIFLGARIGSPLGTGGSTAHFHLGAATGASEEAGLCIFSLDNNAAGGNVGQQQLSTASVMVSTSGTATEDLRADLASMDASGWTLNVTNLPSAALIPGYLALKGDGFKVGVETQKTSTGTKETTGIGFTPAGLLVFGCNAASSASYDNTQMRLSIGASDGTNEGGIWIQDVEIDNSQNAQSTYTSKVLRHATADSTTDAEADLSAFGSGSFTLNWTTVASATAREFIYVAFEADAAVAARPKTLTSLGVG